MGYFGVSLGWCGLKFIEPPAHMEDTPLMGCLSYFNVDPTFHTDAVILNDYVVFGILQMNLFFPIIGFTGQARLVVTL
jgi:hypothetical protein